MNPTYINALNLAFGTQRTRKLIQYLGSAKKTWESPASTLTNLGIKQGALRAIFKRKDLVNPKEQWELLQKRKINLITIQSAAYPKILKQTPSPPLALYIKGNKKLLNTPSLAIVGTRAHSSYAKLVTPKITSSLASSGLTIVSGLAQGIDALAHKATLNARGKTIAVLGCGLHQAFPKINEPLAKDIIKKDGLIISEYPLGTPPLKQHFPARNRIIAGLCLGVLVIESRTKGGSLITVARALEANREVFALPGPIEKPTSEGTNMLIQKGAKLVMSPNDVLEELSLPQKKELLKNTLENLTPNEETILNILKIEPAHIDKIIKKAKLSPATTNSLMTTLELRGIVKNTGGGIYIRSI